MASDSDFLIAFDSERLGYGKVVLSNPHKSGILPGVTVILGKNGSGKTTLGTIIEKGRYAYGNRLGFSDSIRKVKMLTFTDIHSFTGIDVQYFSQRMEATANEYVPVVKDIFKSIVDSEICHNLSATFKLNGVEDKKINYLSSGELRKLLIINALAQQPDLLILDNPYIGLDAASRHEFDEAMERMKAQGQSVVYLLCDAEDVPDYADSVITLSDCVISLPVSAKGYTDSKESEEPTSSENLSLPEKRNLLYPDSDTVFSIKDGHVRYGDKTIFEGFYWEVKRGECWALKGRNGSGKSLLLSMVCADNPQGYSNKITLFDRARGSGESIWEIKDAIGYVCPEMQLYFRSNDSVLEIIVQGLRNSLNRYRPSTPEERSLAKEWMILLDISDLESRKFSELSSGEQRLVLLARALIKQPDLLVLDEPLHGLDSNHKERVKRLISELTERNGSTLIYVSHYDSEIPDCVNKVKHIG